MIKIENLSIHYKGDYVLNHINLEVQRGEFVYLIGRSGAGKSTLFKILNRQIESYKGVVKLEGAPIQEEPRYVTLRRLATIYQSFELVPQKTVFENIALAGEIRGIKPDKLAILVEESVERMGLGGREHAYPNELSGGQQQRVAIARALLNRPSILLADEPTGNLDRETALETLQFIKELNEKDKMTVIFITHANEYVQAYPARTLRLADGEVIEC